MSLHKIANWSEEVVALHFHGDRANNPLNIKGITVLIVSAVKQFYVVVGSEALDQRKLHTIIKRTF